MSTPIPPAAPPSPSPPRAPRNLSPVYVAVGVAVAIAAVLVVFFVVSPLTASTSGGSGASILTYQQARPIADHAAGGFQGGGWTLLFAVGLVSPTNESFPTNTSLFNSSLGCTFNPVVNLVGLTLPGYSGNRSLGEAPAWEFGYVNSDDTAIAVVSVIQGQGTVLGTLTGLECSIAAELVKAVPGNAIDSSQAAAAVRPMAAPFLSAHPNATAEFALVGQFSLAGHTVGPEWSVVYSTCPLSATASGTGSEFNATVNAVSGAVLTNHSGSVSCEASSTTTAVRTAGAPSGGSGFLLARPN